MPIYLRQFYVNQLISQRKKENDEIKKQQQKSKSINQLYHNFVFHTRRATFSRNGLVVDY